MEIYIILLPISLRQKKMIGYIPSYDVSEGLKKTIQWIDLYRRRDFKIFE